MCLFFAKKVEISYFAWWRRAVLELPVEHGNPVFHQRLRLVGRLAHAHYCLYELAWIYARTSEIPPYLGRVLLQLVNVLYDGVVGWSVGYQEPHFTVVDLGWGRLNSHTCACHDCIICEKNTLK